MTWWGLHICMSCPTGTGAGWLTSNKFSIGVSKVPTSVLEFLTLEEAFQPEILPPQTSQLTSKMHTWVLLNLEPMRTLFCRFRFIGCQQVLYSTVSIQIPIIKLATFLVFQRLYISRHHFGGTLWIPAPQTKAKSHGLHCPATGGTGEDLPEDSLSRRSDERAAGYVHKST